MLRMRLLGYQDTAGEITRIAAAQVYLNGGWEFSLRQINSTWIPPWASLGGP
jgi:hypothetical protein